MHRLRDLDRGGRLVALVVMLALTAPFAASVIKAHQVDWTPSNDEALIALRVHDVLHANLPLTGQPSTASQYADVDPPRHPGPIAFYLLAGPVALLGYDIGMVAGAAMFNLAAVLVAVWVAFRRGGAVIGLGAAVVCSAIAWSEGLAVLSDPISSNMGGIPFLALAALAWALLDRDIRLVPLAAFAFAFVAQQHLAILGLSLATAAWGSLGIVLSLRWRHRSSRTLGASNEEGNVEAVTAPLTPARAWPWLAAGVLVSLVAWLPVFIDQFFGSGNVSRVAGFAGSSERPTLGLRSGLTQALRALGLPPLLTRSNLSGRDITASLAPVTLVVSLAVLLALVVIAVRWWRRNRSLASLAATTVVVAVAGAWNGANVPEMEAGRINFYRWAFVVSAGVVATLAWAVVSLIVERQTAVADGSAESSGDRMTSFARPALAVVATVVVMAVATTAIAAGGPQERRDQEVFGIERRFADAAERAVDGNRKVLVVIRGASGVLAVGPALALDLIEAGHVVRVLPDQADGFGDDRVLKRGEQVGAVLSISSSSGARPGPRQGRLIATADLNRDRRPTLERLARQVRGRKQVRSSDAPAILRRFGARPGSPESVLFDAAIDHLGTAPVGGLQDPTVVALLQAGYLDQPQLDPSGLAELARTDFTFSWHDDRFELRLLTSAEARSAFDIEVR